MYKGKEVTKFDLNPGGIIQSTSALKEQVGGDHYSKLAIQPIEYCHANKLGVCESFVVKYVTRWRDAGGVEDLAKAIHTLELLIEMESKKD